jgi:hypothetical protein
VTVPGSMSCRTSVIQLVNCAITIAIFHSMDAIQADSVLGSGTKALVTVDGVWAPSSRPLISA